MVTAVSKKMNRNSSIKTTTTTIIAKKTLESINGSISSASGFRLLIEANGGLGNITYSGGSGSVGLDMCETMSTVSKNSVYKQRIDAMFDDTRWVIYIPTFQCPLHFWPPTQLSSHSFSINTMHWSAWILSSTNSSRVFLLLEAMNLIIQAWKTICRGLPAVKITEKRWKNNNHCTNYNELEEYEIEKPYERMMKLEMKRFT